MDWEPDDRIRDHIIKKIRELGSIKNVNSFYSSDSRVSRYAREIAVKVLSADNNSCSIVCLALSRKYGGYCLAGKRLVKGGKSEWVRPVSARPNGELEELHILYGNNEKIALLDEIQFTFVKRFPHYYQTENVLINKDAKWIKTGTYNPAYLDALCDEPENLWINDADSKNERNDRMPFEKANECLENSLVLIRTEELTIEVQTKTGLRSSLRAHFVFKGIPYILPVTDPLVERQYKKIGIYKLDKKPVFLCISLGEPFGNYCYKLVASVFGI
jgi:hypothetical protein